MICGHFCVLSGRWTAAIAEYTRAHILQPNLSLPLLCLASAFLCGATNRNITVCLTYLLRLFSINPILISKLLNC